MKKYNNRLKDFLILWSTQSLSQLGSSLTGYALTLWLYEQTGSALSTAALTICSYAPYVLMSIFAGALTDRFDKKKLMLLCDSFAAVCTVVTLVLYRAGTLAVWHLYLLNVLSGLMNTVQQPASSVAMTLIPSYVASSIVRMPARVQGIFTCMLGPQACTSRAMRSIFSGSR